MLRGPALPNPATAIHWAMQVHISHYGESRMLFNGTDIQGGRRVRKLAGRAKVLQPPEPPQA